MFVDALTYPVRGSGWVMIVLGTVFSVILDFLKFMPFIGILVALFSAGYFASFYLDIVSTTMTDRDEVPDWPSFSSFVDDIISPFVRVTGLCLISFGPLLALGFADEEAPWFLAAVIAAVGYGCFYFPMAVLASQAFGGFLATLPPVVFPAIFRALPSYLLAVVALVAGFIVCSLAEAFTSEIPYLGWFVTTAVALYSLMFQARLIGLIYRAKREKLGWD